MKKITTILSVFLISAIMFPVVLSAANLTFAPASGTYTEGKTYIVSVFVNPQTSTVYTAKAEVKYPADMLEVKSFNIGNGWMPLTQAGYDALDNTGGVLIKTGGYPSGLTSTTLFGTITFYAKKSGSATINVGSESLVLDANNQNTLTSFSSATFTLVQKPAPAPIPQTTTVQEVSVPTTISETETTEEPTEEIVQERNVVAVSQSGVTLAMNWTLALLLSFATLLAGFLVGRKTNLAIRQVPKK